MSLKAGDMRQWYTPYVPFAIDTTVKDGVTHLTYTNGITDTYLTEDVERFSRIYIDFEKELNEL